MKIVMFTNSYLPMVGGVAGSVDRFSSVMRDNGHKVRIVAPTYDDAPEPGGDDEVYRISAMENFDGSDFSVVLPVNFGLNDWLDDFEPDLVHSHHPFLLGNVAVRYASSRGLGLVFTHHTMYEHYTHYIPVDVDRMGRYAISMSTGYANFCDVVLAPSESTAEIIRSRGVKVPVRVAPTGVDIEQYEDGDGSACRKRLDIPPDVRLIGTVGRLAPEKNLEFLARAAAETLRKDARLWFLAVGSGPSSEKMTGIFESAGVADRVRFAGVLKDQQLIDAYHALDLFAFASKTETQGMVLVEALAAGCPIVALDAPGAREVVDDGHNGRLLHDENAGQFAAAIADLLDQPDHEIAVLSRRARASAEPFETHRCVARVEEVYRQMLAGEVHRKPVPENEWQQWIESLRREWEIWANRLRSIGDALKSRD
ncbi:MAG: glycosyltransferase [Phycisphaerae bacterium]